MGSIFENWPARNFIVWQGENTDLGDWVPRLSNLIDLSWRPSDLSEIANYLSTGAFHSGIVCESEVSCDLCGKSQFHPSRTLSDGVWVWPDSLAHAMLDHSLRLPDAFVTHIRQELANKVKQSQSRASAHRET